MSLVALVLAGLLMWWGPPGAILPSPPGYERITTDPGWCGPRLIFYIARCRGINVTLPDVVTLSQATPSGLASLHDLARVSRELGFSPVGVRAPPIRILRMGGPAVLCVQLDMAEEQKSGPRGGGPLHFVGLLKAGDKQSWILDPAGELTPIEVENDRLLKRMTGHALLLDGNRQRWLTAGSLTPGLAWAMLASPIMLGLLINLRSFWRRVRPRLATCLVMFACAIWCGGCQEPTAQQVSGRATTAAVASPSMLTAEPALADLGVVLQEASPVSAKFRLNNLTEQLIRLEAGMSSCGCSQVRMPRWLEPGGSAEAQLDISIGTREGTWGVEAEIIADDGSHAKQRLLLRAKLLSHPGILVDPPSRLVRVLPGTTSAACEFQVRLPKVWPSGETMPAPQVEALLPGLTLECQDLGITHTHRTFKLKLDLPVAAWRQWRAEHGPQKAVAVVRVASLSRPLRVDLELLDHPVLRAPRIVYAFGLTSAGSYTITLMNHTDQHIRVARVAGTIPGVEVVMEDEVRLLPRLVLRRIGKIESGSFPLEVYLAGVAEPFRMQVNLYAGAGP